MTNVNKKMVFFNEGFPYAATIIVSTALNILLLTFVNNGGGGPEGSFANKKNPKLKNFEIV